MNNNIGILVNSSRSIIYASKNEDFADNARFEASKLQGEMELILKEKNYIKKHPPANMIFGGY